MALIAETPHLDRPAASGPRYTPQRKSVPIFVTLFLLSILLPVPFYIGSVLLNPYRVLLLIAFFPAALRWIGRKAGPIQLPDILLVCFVLWASMTFAIAHGVTEAIEPSGAIILETFGAYLLGRVYIRDVSSFRSMSRLLFLIILCLTPFALIEAVTSRPIILDLIRPITDTFVPFAGERRWGFYRAVVVFPHPILFGIFCSAAMGLTFYVVMMKRTILLRMIGTGINASAALLSFSTGAYVSIAVQVFFMIWDLVTHRVRRRWAILAWLAVAAFASVSVLSNRTPFHVFVTYLTFNVKSSYNRILIWDYGTAEVLRNPLFGIGFNEWERPSFMSASMDNFWLVVAVRHGLPAFLFFAAAILIIMHRIGRLDISDPETVACRKGLLISLGGLILAGVTVHYWNHIYAIFMFLVGSGVWMLDRAPAQTSRSNLASRPSYRGRF